MDVFGAYVVSLLDYLFPLLIYGFLLLFVLLIDWPPSCVLVCVLRWLEPSKCLFRRHAAPGYGVSNVEGSD